MTTIKAPQVVRGAILLACKLQMWMFFKLNVAETLLFRHFGDCLPTSPLV